VDTTGVDAWETLLTQLKEDDTPPCYHLVEQYSTDVLGVPSHDRRVLSKDVSATEGVSHSILEFF
jgi:hypothetical protein